MRAFDEQQHPRETTGQFATKPRVETDVSLDAEPPGHDSVEGARRAVVVARAHLRLLAETMGLLPQGTEVTRTGEHYSSCEQKFVSENGDTLTVSASARIGDGDCHPSSFSAELGRSEEDPSVTLEEVEQEFRCSISSTASVSQASSQSTTRAAVLAASMAHLAAPKIRAMHEHGLRDVTFCPMPATPAWRYDNDSEYPVLPAMSCKIDDEEIQISVDEDGNAAFDVAGLRLDEAPSLVRYIVGNDLALRFGIDSPDEPLDAINAWLIELYQDAHKTSVYRGFFAE